MAVGGLGLEGAQAKDCCRYQQSHTQYLFSCFSLDVLPEMLISSAAHGASGVGGISRRRQTSASVMRARLAGLTLEEK